MSVLIVAKPVYRLHFGHVGVYYKVPYRRSIFKLWSNYGLVAFGLDILWTARKICTEEGCSLIGLFRYCLDMAVPGQSVVYSDSMVLGFRSFIQDLSVTIVESLYDISLVGDPDMFALVWVIWVKNHLPIFFPFL